MAVSYTHLDVYKRQDEIPYDKFLGSAGLELKSETVKMADLGCLLYTSARTCRLISLKLATGPE